MGLGFAGVGALMLALVLFTYLRMIGKRMQLREKRAGREDRLLIEQAETLIAFGREQDALKLLQNALQKTPKSEPIQARLTQLQLEMAERDTHH